MVSETVNKSGGTQEPQDNSLNEDNKSKGNTKTTSPPNDDTGTHPPANNPEQAQGTPRDVGDAGNVPTGAQNGHKAKGKWTMKAPDIRSPETPEEALAFLRQFVEPW